MSDFQMLVKTRRSANKFTQGIEIPRSEFEEMFGLVKFSPSAFNLQHAQFLVVDDPDVKEQVYNAAYQQYKVKSSSAVVVVLGDMLAYQQAPQIYEGLLQLGVISQLEYNQTIDMINGTYEGNGPVFQREEAIRNASLAAMTFMLTAKDRGWDTCPMIGFDPAQLSNVLNLPERYVPVMLITIGQEDTTSLRPRGYRKPVGEFVSFNRL
ncbi:nitroreductase family protein [Tumebacillus permanentifrigoris]|uniref:Putative NAD(P)H nitroreductase n=1 Tax=Tumebacillus permanentifrigoris TaxID=378543 RepID=A0A316DEU8_9BACL|nr:nitroreductase family protein [Tumebacillus permanentifrigoris]PWK16564.1 putative NAD(P)H nitroreductase [Tumebacillus permanentifrigoris]